MALYADENFPLRVIEHLRGLGHDVLTAFEDGKATNQSLIKTFSPEPLNLIEHF